MRLMVVNFTFWLLAILAKYLWICVSLQALQHVILCVSLLVLQREILQRCVCDRIDPSQKESALQLGQIWCSNCTLKQAIYNYSSSAIFCKETFLKVIQKITASNLYQ